MMRAGENAEAVKTLQDLVARNEGATMLWATLAQAEVAAGDREAGLATFSRAMNLFPRNIPLAVRYADALASAGRAKEAHTLLLDLFNAVEPTPEQIRQIALVASAAGDTGDAYYYMSEYHIGSGDLRLASQQLELALAAPNLTPVQRKRYAARLKEIRDFLTEEARRDRRKPEQDDSGQRGGRGSGGGRGQGRGAYLPGSAGPFTMSASP